MFGLLTLTSVLFAAPVPATGAAPDPVLTFHFAPASVLEKDVFRLMESMPLPDKETALKQDEGPIEIGPGRKGLGRLRHGTKPSTGYVVFDDKNVREVVRLPRPARDGRKVVPRLPRPGGEGDGRRQHESCPSTAAPGVYELKGKNNDVPKHVRVHNGYAYLGINAPLDAFAADKLVPAAKTLVPEGNGQGRGDRFT